MTDIFNPDIPYPIDDPENEKEIIKKELKCTDFIRIYKVVFLTRKWRKIPFHEFS